MLIYLSTPRIPLSLLIIVELPSLRGNDSSFVKVVVLVVVMINFRLQSSNPSGLHPATSPQNFCPAHISSFLHPSVSALQIVIRIYTRTPPHQTSLSPPFPIFFPPPLPHVHTLFTQPSSPALSSSSPPAPVSLLPIRVGLPMTVSPCRNVACLC